MKTSSLVLELVLDTAQLFVDSVKSDELDYDILRQFLDQDKEAVKYQIFISLFEIDRNAQTLSKYFSLISDLSFKHRPEFFEEDGLENSHALYEYMYSELFRSTDVQNLLEFHYSILTCLE